MSIQLKQFPALADEKSLLAASHVVFILNGDSSGRASGRNSQSSDQFADKTLSNASNKPARANSKLAGLAYARLLETRLKRSRSQFSELAKTPMSADLPGGGLATWVLLDAKLTAFQRHALLRKAIQPLLDEKPQSLSIAVYGGDKMRQQSARDAFYVTCVNAAELPDRKGNVVKISTDKANAKPRSLKTIQLYGWQEDDGFAAVKALVAGNTLARQLTMLPPNDLTPTLYRDKVQKLASDHGWKHKEYDMKKLKKMGAGAFVAVGAGSDPQDAAIVHLSYAPKRAAKHASKHDLAHIALVGKGICFDTGGHNLKPAKYMNGMHEDMNGSAVALGILLAASLAQWPLKIDCWLAIAQNHIGPLAYKQNDVVTALNGTTIEIVHTDAEGRMVLADTLTLASREKPALMVDFATLTGSMIAALGDRYSGVLGNRPELLAQAVAAGAQAGERVCAFPFDEDYDEELDSSMADIKQCTLEGGADHVLATRFLSKFIEGDVPWVHVDLSCANRKGGLGAVGSDVTGFGVAFGLELLKLATKETPIKQA